MRRTAARSLAVVAGLTVAGLLVAPAAAYAGKPTRGGTTTDRTAPSVTIGSPAAGATVSSPFTVTGSASDNVAVSKVTVAVDGGTATTASGTATWSWSSSSLPAGSHTVRAAAYDAAGNVTSTSVSVSVQGGATITGNGLTATRTDVVNADSSSTRIIGRGRTTERNGLSAFLYRDAFSWVPYVEFRTTVGISEVALPGPVPSSAQWLNASAELDGSGGLWVFAGGGPVTAKHYLLSGSPLPTSLTLDSTQTFGDTDSRANDLRVLSSGGVALSWHQFGTNGAPQGITVAYRSTAGMWSTSGLISMQTQASKWVSAQHPADGSYWVFGDKDAGHQVIALRFVESGGALTLDKVDPAFITVAQYGDFGPEAENPDLQVAADPSTSTLVLAYQGNVYQQFGDPATNGVKGAHVVVARIPASGALTFSSLDVWAERVSHVALIVQPGVVWVAYHPVDPVTLDYRALEVAKLSGGTWSGPLRLGTTVDAGDPVGYGVTPVVLADMGDGKVGRFTLS
jgi:hypothetical protein